MPRHAHPSRFREIRTVDSSRTIGIERLHISDDQFWLQLVIFAIAFSVVMAIVVLNDLQKRMLARKAVRQHREVPKKYRNNKTNWKMVFVLLVAAPLFAIMRVGGSDVASFTYLTLSPETQATVDTVLLWLPFIFRLGLVLLLLLGIAYIYLTLRFQRSQDAVFERIENRLLKRDWAGTREEVERLLSQKGTSIKTTTDPLLLNYQHGFDSICGHWSEAKDLFERQKTLASRYEFGVTFDVLFCRAQGQLEQAELLARERRVDDGVGKLALAIILCDQNKSSEAGKIVEWLDRLPIVQISLQEKSILKVIYDELVKLTGDEPPARTSSEYRDAIASAAQAILVLNCHRFRVKWHQMTRRVSVVRAASIDKFA